MCVGPYIGGTTNEAPGGDTSPKPVLPPKITPPAADIVAPRIPPKKK